MVALKQQVRCSYKGINMSNNAAPLLHLYLERKTFAELGYRFDPEDTTTWEANAYLIIDKEITKLRREDDKKEKLKRK